MNLIHQDYQYQDIIDTILKWGIEKGDRTGTGTLSFFGTTMRFDLSNGKVPLLDTKKVFHKGIIHELIWMLSGDTNIRYLKEHDVTIWDSWVKKGTEEFIDLTFEERLSKCDQFQLDEISTLIFIWEDEINKIQVDRKEQYREISPEIHLLFKTQTFDKLPVLINKDFIIVANDLMDGMGKPTKKLIAGDLPKIYQQQWRNWDDTRIIDSPNGELEDYVTRGFKVMGSLGSSLGAGDDLQWVVQRKVDQIAWVIDRLKTNPDCRRMIVSAWNAAEIEEMALPPCHMIFQFWTRELKAEERYLLLKDSVENFDENDNEFEHMDDHTLCDQFNIPRRALSCLMFQR